MVATLNRRPTDPAWIRPWEKRFRHSLGSLTASMSVPRTYSEFPNFSCPFWQTFSQELCRETLAVVTRRYPVAKVLSLRTCWAAVAVYVGVGLQCRDVFWIHTFPVTGTECKRRDSVINTYWSPVDNFICLLSTSWRGNEARDSSRVDGSKVSFNSLRRNSDLKKMERSPLLSLEDDLWLYPPNQLPENTLKGQSRNTLCSFLYSIIDRVCFKIRY